MDDYNVRAIFYTVIPQKTSLASVREKKRIGFGKWSPRRCVINPGLKRWYRFLLDFQPTKTEGNNDSTFLVFYAFKDIQTILKTQIDNPQNQIDNPSMLQESFGDIQTLRNQKSRSICKNQIKTIIRNSRGNNDLNKPLE